MFSVRVGGWSYAVDIAPGLAGDVLEFWVLEWPVMDQRLGIWVPGNLWWGKGLLLEVWACNHSNWVKWTFKTALISISLMARSAELFFKYLWPFAIFSFKTCPFSPFVDWIFGA